MPVKEDGSMQITRSKNRAGDLHGAASRSQPAKDTDVCYKISLSETICMGGGHYRELVSPGNCIADSKLRLIVNQHGKGNPGLGCSLKMFTNP